MRCVCVVCVRVCVRACVRARVYALKIVSKDKILRFTNTSVIIFITITTLNVNGRTFDNFLNGINLLCGGPSVLAILTVRLQKTKKRKKDEEDPLRFQC